MHVKQYLADTMPDAMSKIRSDLGPNAIILHSEKVPQKGFRRFWKQPKLKVVAAVDTDLQDFPQPTVAADETIQDMQAEIAVLKTTLSEVSAIRAQNEPAKITSLDEWHQRLLTKGVAEHLAQRIIQVVGDELSHWALDNDTVLNQHVYWNLGRQLPDSTNLQLTPGKTHVCFIVGPTGVGKTTTIAKLAANFAYAARKNYRVLIATTDTFRVAALPQISTFGEILNIPVEVTYSPDQLATLVEKNSHQDLILVDTPGRSQLALDEVAEIGDYINVVADKTVYLALTAGTKREDMKQTITTFSKKIPLDGLILTKIDETISMGAAYSMICEMGIPVSYFTTGQRVPEDIEIANSERLVEMLVGSESTESCESDGKKLDTSRTNVVFANNHVLSTEKA